MAMHYKQGLEGMQAPVTDAIAGLLMFVNLQHGHEVLQAVHRC